MFKKHILPWLCGAFGPWCIKGIGASLVWDVRGREHLESVSGKAHVLVFWHARILFMAYFFRHRGYHVLVSENTDGEMITRAVAHMGIGAIRGSTSRGASKVILSSARLLKSGRSIAFTPDGPRGPRHVFQPGALSAARLGGADILPVTASANHAFIFSSWDRFVLPKFRARAVLEFLPPRPPPSKDNMEQERRRLEGALAAATDALDGEMGLVF